MKRLFRTSFKVTQPFGVNPDVYRKYGLTGHEGIDLIPTGESWIVLALADGKIIKDTDNPKSGVYGNNVLIWHQLLNKATQYCHLQINNVELGKQVHAGDAIGVMGSTGNATGAHVHLNVFNCDSNGTILNKGNGYFAGIDPMPFLQSSDTNEMTRRQAIEEMLEGFRGAGNVPAWLLDQKDASGQSLADLTRDQYDGYGRQYILDLFTGFYGHPTDAQVGKDKWSIGAIKTGKALRDNP